MSSGAICCSLFSEAMNVRGVLLGSVNLAPSGAPSFSIKNRIMRVIWGVVWLVLARWTPKSFRRLRIGLLRCFGAEIGAKCDVRGSVRVWYPPNLTMENRTILAEGVNCYNMAHITIREQTIVSQGAFLCGGTHDFADRTYPLITKPIEIGPFAWVAAEAFVGPGCRVSEGCVVGARAVVFGELTPWSVYAGNPATRVKSRSFQN